MLRETDESDTFRYKRGHDKRQDFVDYLLFSATAGLICAASSEVACSKRSDSGERCRVKKAMKSRGGLGREVRERL